MLNQVKNDKLEKIFAMHIPDNRLITLTDKVHKNWEEKDQ